MSLLAKDYYALLQISPLAEHDEIRAQYRKIIKENELDSLIGDLNQAKKWGNKILISALETEISLATERAKHLNEAYSVLSNTTKRSKYDREYFESKPPIIIISPSSSLDFGLIKSGDSRKASFLVNVIGKISEDIKISWRNNPSWAKFSQTSRSLNSKYPIEITVIVEACDGLSGLQSDEICISVGGQTNSVDVTYIGIANVVNVTIPKKGSLSRLTIEDTLSNKGSNVDNDNQVKNGNHESQKGTSSTHNHSPKKKVQKWFPLSVIGTVLILCLGATSLLCLLISLYYVNKSDQFIQEDILNQNPPIDFYIKNYGPCIPKWESGVDPLPDCGSYTNTNVISFVVSPQRQNIYQLMLDDITINNVSIQYDCGNKNEYGTLRMSTQNTENWYCFEEMVPSSSLRNSQLCLELTEVMYSYQSGETTNKYRICHNIN